MIGSSLKQLREIAGHTQAHLADLIGLKQAQISAVEIGRRITTTDVFERWIVACGGTLQIIAPGAKPDPLASLSTPQRAMMAAMMELTEEEQELLAQTAEAMANTPNPYDKAPIMGTLDGLLSTYRRRLKQEGVIARKEVVVERERKKAV